ncbi:maltase A3-like [Periplaneta americana]|uniref:maltase A3-like n=1 Tax=Periplaneta americana TaxID=6978 RepID=UPI0037E9895D
MAGFKTFLPFVAVFVILPCTWALEWWQTKVIYQIYPRSFMDYDGDGIGDLKGITQKLDHLKDLGVGAVWISPIYKSPMEDFGYDISNFREIDPVFGTMDDFDDLQKRAKELDIKLLMDFVPNDSSVEHEWFQLSLNRTDPYTDYYVWHDGRILENGTRVEPNNWQSVFSGSAWQWREERQQYYLHQFAVHQPDLNHDSPFLVEEMKNVLRFWLDKGVDGFRMDAISWLFEGPVDDRPESEITPPQNFPETYEAVVQWRKILNNYTNLDGRVRFMMTEVSANDTELVGFYGTSAAPGAHFPFNFWLIFAVNNESTAYDFRDTITRYMDLMEGVHWPNWVLGNHDQHRVGSRFGAELVDAFNMLALLLPGTAVTYQGEEIGMLNTYVTWEQCLDPQGLYAGPQHYLERTRDLERTPYQWDATTSAGFSTNATTWLPVNSNYKELNLDAQKATEKSHYWVYKKLVQLRQSQSIQYGDLQIVAFSEQIFAFSRSYPDSESYVVIVNLGSSVESVTIDSSIQTLYVRVASVQSMRNEGDEVEAIYFSMSPKEALVLSTSP